MFLILIHNYKYKTLQHVNHTMSLFFQIRENFHTKLQHANGS